MESEVSDHCRNFALSCPKDPSYQVTCTHEHNPACKACETLKSCLEDIKQTLEEANFPSDATRADFQYRFAEAQKAVKALKERQLRIVHQVYSTLTLIRS